MYLLPLVQVQINHDSFDIISLIINSILGVAAVSSLWLSRRAFRKSEFDSAMNTSPSIIVRPHEIWAGIRDSAATAGYGEVDEGRVIKKGEYYEVAFSIGFECFNVGRGAAFNISQPKTIGMPISTFRLRKTPLYLTTSDDPFVIELMLKGKFDELYKSAETKIPVKVILTYTNDQNNIFCRSIWEAKIKPFDRDGEDLKVRDVRILQRSGRVEYSQKPYK